MICIHIYIYIYLEGERKRERDRETERPIDIETEKFALWSISFTVCQCCFAALGLLAVACWARDCMYV